MSATTRPFQPLTVWFDSHLFDAGREVCDDFQHVVGFGKVLTDKSLLGTNHPDGQTGTWGNERDQERRFRPDGRMSDPVPGFSVNDL